MIDHSCVHVLTCRVLHARGKCAYMCQNTFCQAFAAVSSSICVEDCLAVFQGWAVWCVLGSICCDMLDLVCCDMYVVIEIGFGGPCQEEFEGLRGTTCSERIWTRIGYEPWIPLAQDGPMHHTWCIAKIAWHAVHGICADTRAHTPRHVSTCTYLMQSTCIYISMYLHWHVWMHVSIFTCTRVSALTWEDVIHMHLHLQGSTSTCIYIYM